MKKISITMAAMVMLTAIAAAQHHNQNGYYQQSVYLVGNGGSNYYNDNDGDREEHQREHRRHHNYERHEHQEYNSCNDNYYIRPMSAQDFEYAKQSIASRGFDNTRLLMAKQIVGSNRLLCGQIRQLMNLMSFESTRMELAKYAWYHALDKQNFYTLNDAFVFESSVMELNNFTSYN